MYIYIYIPVLARTGKLGCIKYVPLYISLGFPFAKGAAGNSLEEQFRYEFQRSCLGFPLRKALQGTALKMNSGTSFKEFASVFDRISCHFGTRGLHFGGLWGVWDPKAPPESQGTSRKLPRDLPGIYKTSQKGPKKRPRATQGSQKRPKSTPREPKDYQKASKKTSEELQNIKRVTFSKPHY